MQLTSGDFIFIKLELAKSKDVGIAEIDLLRTFFIPRTIGRAYRP